MGERAAVSTKDKPAKRSSIGAMTRRDSSLAVEEDQDDEIDEAEEQEDD